MSLLDNVHLPSSILSRVPVISSYPSPCCDALLLLSKSLLNCFAKAKFNCSNISPSKSPKKNLLSSNSVLHLSSLSSSNASANKASVLKKSTPSISLNFFLASSAANAPSGSTYFTSLMIRRLVIISSSKSNITGLLGLTPALSAYVVSNAWVIIT